MLTMCSLFPAAAVRVIEDVVGGTRVNVPSDTAIAEGQEHDGQDPAVIKDVNEDKSVPGW